MQVALVIDDGLVAPFPDAAALERLVGEPLRFQNLRMDADDEDLLVVRPVEDPDASPFRQALRRSPQEIVVELRRAWMLEAEHLTSLRVDPGHDVLDDAVLAGGIHGLKDQQQRVAVVRVEQVLPVGQLLDVIREERAVVLLRVVEGRDARPPFLRDRPVGLREPGSVRRRSTWACEASLSDTNVLYRTLAAHWLTQSRCACDEKRVRCAVPDRLCR